MCKEGSKIDRDWEWIDFILGWEVPREHQRTFHGPHSSFLSLKKGNNNGSLKRNFRKYGNTPLSSFWLKKYSLLFVQNSSSHSQNCSLRVKVSDRKHNISAYFRAKKRFILFIDCITRKKRPTCRVEVVVNCSGFCFASSHFKSFSQETANETDILQCKIRIKKNVSATA